MKIRQVLIIITAITILLLFLFTSRVSYDAGIKHGVKNAEKIREDQAKNTETYTKKTRSVFVTKVNNTKIQSQISSSGRVVSSNNITISSEVQGRLIGKNTFKKGTEIKKGEIIFSIENSELQNLHHANKSKFKNMVLSALPDINLDFNSELSKWEKFKNTINLNSNLPDFPNTKTKKEENFTSRIKEMYYSIKSEEERLKKYTVCAPFDGTIIKSYSDVGGSVNPGTPVVDFIRKGDMEIELTVNRSEIKYINVGDDVIFIDNKREYKGKIIRKAKFVNMNTQNISIFASIKTNESSVYSGMYLSANITTKKNKKGFKIPRRALINKDIVYIVNANDKLQKQKVNIIGQQGNNLIIDNLQNNILVVNEPLIAAKEGEIVKAIVR